MRQRAPSLWLARALVPATLSLSFGAPLSAQLRRDVPSTPSCLTCSVTLSKVVTLGAADGPGAFSTRPYFIGQDSRGRFYAVTPDSPDELPYVFDAQGRYLQRLGRVGDGPGEFRSPTVLRVRQDTLYVLDTSGRITILSPSYAIVTTFTGPRGAMDALPLSNGTIVVNALVRDRDRFGFMQHLLDRRGNYLGSFDPDTLAFNPRNITARKRVMADGGTGRMWTAPLAHHYVVSAWSLTGQLEKQLTRTPTWFPSYDRAWLVSPTVAPMPYVLGLWEAPDGYLWVVARVADPNWKQGLGKAVEVEGRTIYPVDDAQEVYDSVIEVIDPLTARLVASTRLPGTIDVVIRPGLVAGVRETEKGALVADVFRVQWTSP